MKSLTVSNVSIKFRLNKERPDTIKGAVFNMFKKKERSKEEFWALKDVSFSLERGDRLGILGLNGAGKSTLLKVIAGVYKPTEGYVRRKGTLAPLIELGAGFSNDYTAVENTYLYGAVLGYTRSFIDEKVEEIIEFAELEKFRDVPIKSYSSGMRSRLGFSICTAVHPDVLILDEVLSVGDARFKKKSKERVLRLMGSETTVLYVSHSVNEALDICNKGMILHEGKVIAFGPMKEIAAKYEEMTS